MLVAHPLQEASTAHQAAVSLVMMLKCASAITVPSKLRASVCVNVRISEAAQPGIRQTDCTAKIDEEFPQVLTA